MKMMSNKPSPPEWREEVVLLKRDAATDILGDFEAVIIFLEILEQQLHRKTALHLKLVENAGPRAGDGRRREVRSEDLRACVGKRVLLLIEDNRERVRLLTRRARRGPHTNGTPGSARALRRFGRSLSRKTLNGVVSRKNSVSPVVIASHTSFTCAGCGVPRGT
jgi:hypothetical protein